MHKHARKLHGVFLLGHTVFVFEGIDLLPVTRDFSSLGIDVNRHVGQTFEFIHQDRIGFKCICKFNQSDVRHNARQIYSSFHTGVAATNDGHMLALKKRTIAMRAVGYAFVFVLFFARHIDVAPTRACGQHHTAST